MKILNVRTIVESLLKTSEPCRNSDARLLASIWAHFLGEDVDKMNATDLLNKISGNEMPNPESIRRMRQKLQEINPDYRGTTYVPRQQEQKPVREDIKKVTRQYNDNYQG